MIPTRKQVVEALATIVLALYAEPAKKPRSKKPRSKKKKARKKS